MQPVKGEKFMEMQNTVAGSAAVSGYYEYYQKVYKIKLSFIYFLLSSIIHILFLSQPLSR